MTGRDVVYIPAEVAQVHELYGSLLAEEQRLQPIQQQLAAQAERVWEAHQSGNPTAAIFLRSWHPVLVGHDDSAIAKAELTLEDARETIAREYGFARWSAVEVLQDLAPDPEFESAVDALLRGDVHTLQEQLHSHPSLVREQSRFGHRATLLHYCGSNGVETFRQVVPRNLAQLTEILLDAGAAVDASANMYGGATALTLLVTSRHPADAGVVDETVKVFRDFGASLENG